MPAGSMEYETQGWELKGLGAVFLCVDTSVSLDSQENCV